ncbi:hypothetical protein ZEAMMB73_Zm00001d003855 [Zea mays]|uniref:Uncharacterized protein n=1 Tax=Zea mays TaxID=4577 RepID=A0A1D6EBY6_MAIZE|nr:hypothetical protein ZEAMMB73_Zm00001d003855 [Zea mays]
MLEISLANTSLERSIGCCFDIHAGVCFLMVESYCLTASTTGRWWQPGHSSLWLYPLYSYASMIHCIARYNSITIQAYNTRYSYNAEPEPCE